MTTTPIVLMLLLDIVVFAVTFVAVRCALLSRHPPDFVIGTGQSPYMNRWYVIPRNRWFNIYLHQIMRSDDDRALHDHPWLNLSIVLKGGYWEIVPEQRPSPDWTVPPTMDLWRGRGSFVLRRPSAAHRLVISTVEPCWSLFITGPIIREWGFWCPRGWKRSADFLDKTNTGLVGPGCGEG